MYYESEGTSHIDFQNIKAASDTIKVWWDRLRVHSHTFYINVLFLFFLQKNPKLEFSQSELLKLLSYLEGELQARDVVIATLKVSTNLSHNLVNI